MFYIYATINKVSSQRDVTLLARRAVLAKSYH